MPVIVWWAVAFAGTFGEDWRAASEAQEAGQLADAAARYAALYRAYPNHEHAPEALYSAGWLSGRSGDAARAAALYGEYVERYPQRDASAGLLMRLSLDAAGQLLLERSIALLTTCIAHHGDKAEAQDASFNLGMIRALLGDYPGAAEAFDAYLRRYPDAPDRDRVAEEAARMRALGTGAPPGAGGAATAWAALQGDPTSIALSAAHVEALIASGRRDAARLWLDAAHGRVPGSEADPSLRALRLRLRDP